MNRNNFKIIVIVFSLFILTISLYNLDTVARQMSDENLYANRDDKVVFIDIVTDGVSDLAGLKVGDVFLKINGEKINVHKDSFRSWLHINDFVRAVEKCLYLSQNFEIINIGHDEIVKTEHMAMMICNKISVDFSKKVNIMEQPKKMTLNKTPYLHKQSDILSFYPEIDLDFGLDELIKMAKNG